MSAFADTLEAIAARVPETQMVMIMGTDGIPIERLVVRPDPNLEAVAAEYTTLLRASVSAASDTGLGELLELSVVTEKMTALLVGITPEYFLFAGLAPGALLGRARFALRLGRARPRARVRLGRDAARGAAPSVDSRLLGRPQYGLPAAAARAAN